MNETTLNRALEIILAKSPKAGEEAIRVMAAARNKTPNLSIRYANLLIKAFADPEADFTDKERETLAEAVDLPSGETKEYMLRVRLTETERETLQTAAENLGISMSAYVKMKVFGE